MNLRSENQTKLTVRNFQLQVGWGVYFRLITIKSLYGYNRLING
jgi:hypothetical protein